MVAKQSTKLKEQPRVRPKLRLRANVSIGEDTLAVFGKVGNASAYVDSLVMESWIRWQRAIGVVRRYGWRKDEIRTFLALAPALEFRPYYEVEAFDSNVLQYPGEYVPGRCVRLEEWATMIDQLGSSPALARAATELHAEHRRGNVALEEAIDMLG